VPEARNQQEAIMQTKLLIHAAFVKGEGKSEENVLDPATGKQIAQVPCSARCSVRWCR